MIMHIRRSSKTGFTLFEVILSLAVSAVIISAVAMAFQVSLTNSRLTFSNNEALQHARLAMDKIIRDLRYAAKIKGAPTDVLEFYTRTRVNDDWHAEVILYHKNGDVLERSINGEPATVIAGVGPGDIRISVLQTRLLKENTTGGLTNAMGVHDAVVAVEVTLGVLDEFGNEVRLIATACMRNV
ncbi:MAG: prepilin-type N-terminal cleavage/methylation domain-containing protein [Candidatus Omnitrophica bacterium]|nr:prepilin-type N-terminal cleavage/methylation domain-containing protein [Candidatus Omnitrophota bacterium]